MIRIALMMITAFLLHGSKVYATAAVSIVTMQSRSEGKLNHSISGLTVSSNPSVTTYGLLIGYQILKELQFELAFFYYNRGFEYKLANLSTQLLFNSLQVPVLLRYYPIPCFSIGAGAYFSEAIGNYTIISASQTNQKSFSNGLFFPTDFGAVTSLRVEIPLPLHLKILIEGRYLFGLAALTPQSNDLSNVRIHETQWLAGAQLKL